MNTTRKEMRDVIRLYTMTQVIELAPDQFFCATNKAWEIWQEKPAMRLVKRIPRKRVYFVTEK